ncbi:MAG: putative toxin-antitoxin system toxin component, PIN family [Pirellulales bacterium]
MLDTNVLVRATKNATGPAREVLERLQPPGHVLVLSRWLLAELRRVLQYPRVQALHRMTMEETDDFISDLEVTADIVDVPPDLQPAALSTDPDDDAVIATAVAGRADALCTLDRHLRHADVQAYCQARGIAVLSDTELLTLLRQPPEAGD